MSDAPEPEVVAASPPNGSQHAASRVSAVVYGNIVLLTAMLGLSPEAVREEGGLAVLLATGFATFVAHVVSGLIGHRVETRQRSTRADLRDELRLASPIATAALVPTVLLLLSRQTSLEPNTALLIAVGYVSFRLARLGWTVERAMGERSSRRIFWAGIGLAAAGLLAAILKITLVHH